MFNLFKKKEDTKENNVSLIAVCSLLIHSAKIDENYTEKEKNIIIKALIEMGAKDENLEEIIREAETKEQDSNQILDFTKDIKSADKNFKIKLIESLWKIIYSDNNSDMYESSLMRRISGLLYLDSKLVGDLKEKIKNNLNR